MITDQRTTFAEDVAITLGAGTNLIGDVIDAGSARDLGAGKAIYLNILVTEAFAGGTDMSFVLASDGAAAISTNGSENRHNVTDVFTDAQLTLGFRPPVETSNPRSDTSPLLMNWLT